MIEVPPRRVWDACTIIYHLAGYENAKPDVPRIVEDAVRGHTEIIVSVLAECEVVELEGDDDATAERRITDFFNRPYVLRVAVDPLIARETRRLVRSRGVKPPDAIYLATAIRHQVPLLETYDDDLLALDGLEGNPTVGCTQTTAPCGARSLLAPPELSYLCCLEITERRTAR